MDAAVSRMAAEADSAPVAFLRIKQSYRFGDNAQVLLVVEGKDDRSYYETRASQAFELGAARCSLTTLLAITKRNIIRTHDWLDWTRFDRARILFFVDRDFGDFVQDGLPSGENVYVTDGYSLENSLCSESAFIRILASACDSRDGLSQSDEAELSGIYRTAMGEASPYLLECSVHQIAWAMSGETCYLQNLETRRLFECENASLIPQYDLPDFIDQVYVRCRVERRSVDLSPEQSSRLRERVSEKGVFMLARGKYVMELFCLLVHGMREVRLSSGVSFRKVGRLSSDGVQMTSAHADSPTTLNAFLKARAAALRSAQARLPESAPASCAC